MFGGSFAWSAFCTGESSENMKYAGHDAKFENNKFELTVCLAPSLEKSVGRELVSTRILHRCCNVPGQAQDSSSLALHASNQRKT